MKKYKTFLIMLVIVLIGVTSTLYFCQETGNGSGTLSYGAEKTTSFPEPGITHYNMDLYLDVTTRTLYGETYLQTSNTLGKPIHELWFTTYPNAFSNAVNTPAPPEAYYAGFNEGWMAIDKLQVNGQPTTNSSEGNSFKASINGIIKPGDKLNITISWRTRIPRLAYRFGMKDCTYILGSFYPSLNVYDDDGWHNPYNSAFGDPFCFACANYTVNLNVPEAYNLVSTGINQDRIAEDNGRQIYVVDAQNVRDFCMVLLYDYTELQELCNKTVIKCYVPAGENDQGKQYLQQAGVILDYYNRLLGSYPYPDFKVVFVPLKGFNGMEYSGMIMLNSDFLLPNADKQQSEFVLAHEIAHQWWYGIVGSDQIREPWLDEGLANWCAAKYMEKFFNCTPPGDYVDNEIYLNRQLRDFTSRDDYYRIVYSGGEAFWIGLDKKLGNNLVSKILHHYLADYRYKMAKTEDLLEIIKIEAHNNMDGYFAKWFIKK